MKASFLNHEKALITSMVIGANPDRVKYLMDKSLDDGAEAFGIQIERMDKEYLNTDTYKEIFSYAKGLPFYATNYRRASNEGKPDEELAEELLKMADCGATLCDVMGDYYDAQPDEVAVDENAIKKQMELIDKLHQKGAEVLMSSHIFKFTPAERILEIALEHQRRGADICKIVSGASNMEEQMENLKICNMLKEKLDIPFLFLSAGNSNILRRIGGELGCCMYLCVYEHDDLSIQSQPLIKNLKAIRDNM